MVDREEESWGWAEERKERKALRLLMVRGMPLKEMHLRPISRMNSADSKAAFDDKLERRDEASVSRGSKEEGELRVNVAAACFLFVYG